METKYTIKKKAKDPYQQVIEKEGIYSTSFTLNEIKAQQSQYERFIKEKNSQVTIWKHMLDELTKKHPMLVKMDPDFLESCHKYFDLNAKIEDFETALKQAKKDSKELEKETKIIKEKLGIE